MSDPEEKEICIINGMISTKTNLLPPNTVFKKAQSFVDEKLAEIVESLKQSNRSNDGRLVHGWIHVAGYRALRRIT